MDNYYGVYVGIVEDLDDPESRGRLKVRVATVYGDVLTDNIPWALVQNGFGGFYDGGSFTLYPKGASVLVAFIQGDSRYPVVLGGVPKRPVYVPKAGGEADPGLSWRYEGPTSAWYPKDGKTDVPLEARDLDRQPSVIFKSPKGATLYIYEEDGGELLRIVDRAGQVFEMSAPIKESENVGNKAQRGDGNVVDGGALALSKVEGGTRIRIKDLGGQEILMECDALNPLERRVSVKTSGDIVLESTGAASTVQLGGLTVDPTDGVVTGKCSCMVMGLPHIDVSLKVRALKVSPVPGP